MKILLGLLIILSVLPAFSQVIDYGPPQDALGHWEFDLYDALGNQRGTSANPFYYQRNWTLGVATDSVSAVPIDGTKATYSAAITNIAITSSNSTDIFTISGSATKTIRILRVGLTGAQTTSGQRDVTLIKRSTADIGSPIAVAIIPHDSNNAAATASVAYYATTLPTLGTTVGLVRSARLFFASTITDSDTYFWDFGTRPGQAIVLRGTAQQLALNLNGVSSGGTIVSVNVEYTEE